MSGDLSWMEAFLPLERVRTSVMKLCAMRGAYHLSDEILSDALAEACERNDWNPRLASFTTYIIGIAKYKLMQRFRDMQKEVEFPVDFVDEYLEEMDVNWGSGEPPNRSGIRMKGHMMVPAVPFQDPFFDEYLLPHWYRALWESLADNERKALGYMLLCSDRGIKCTYRDLGKVLGCSHVKAGNVMADVRRKAKEAIAWTKALSAQADDWAATSTSQ